MEYDREAVIAAIQAVYYPDPSVLIQLLRKLEKKAILNGPLPKCGSAGYHASRPVIPRFYLSLDPLLDQWLKECWPVPIVTSIINLKGGVGKTTLTLAMAHFLAIEHHKRVLVIDLDPQTNATVCLITESEWQERDETGRTLYQLFADQVKGSSRFHPDASIVRNVSNVGGGVQGLDLLPSSLRLIKVQDRVTQITDFETYERGPIFALRDTLAEYLPYYEHVLIDCPPSLGVVTLNGLAISDSYIIPVVPDTLSLLGVPPILDRVEHFGSRTRRNIRALGIVVSKMRAQTLLHNEMLRRLREDFVLRRYPTIFQTVIPESTRIAEAANVMAPINTLQQKYGNGGPYDELSALTREYLSYASQ